MRHGFLSVLLGFALSVGVGRAQAADLSALSDSERKQVNEWMAQRATVMIDAHKLQNELARAWTETAYTSPDVEKLRARYRELQQELLRTQHEIQEKVQEIPAVQAKVRQLEETKKREQELKKKIVEKTGE